MNADEALTKVLTWDFRSVLDIGSGGTHADIFRSHGKSVTTINLYDADYVGDYLNADLGRFDCLWASHVLEHQRNPGLFLEKCYGDLHPNGILAVTVPPLKHAIVGGHVTLWNAGLLLYHLILAGFNCQRASVKTYGYNISVIVRKKRAAIPRLKMDYGDVTAISKYFPIPIREGFDGRIEKVNW